MLGNVDYLCGVSPVFAGLHSFKTASYGRSYHDVAHVCYPWHIERPLSERVTTVCLPIGKEPWVIVHELGHVWHEKLNFDITPKPITEYATTDDLEAFAEAFTAWLCPEYPQWTRDSLREDEPTISFLESFL